MCQSATEVVRNVLKIPKNEVHALTDLWLKAPDIYKCSTQGIWTTTVSLHTVVEVTSSGIKSKHRAFYLDRTLFCYIISFGVVVDHNYVERIVYVIDLYNYKRI